MIFDHRTYTIQPGKTNEYVKIFEEFAYPVAMKHGLNLVAYFVSKVGTLNQVVHIWSYNDMMEFETLREQRDADPEWTRYRQKIAGMIVAQEDKITEEDLSNSLRAQYESFKKAYTEAAKPDYIDLDKLSLIHI